MTTHERGDRLMTAFGTLGAIAGSAGMFFIGIQAGNGDVQREQSIQQAEHRLLASLSPEAQKFILDQSKITSPDEAVTAAQNVTGTTIYPLVKTYQNLERERQTADNKKNEDQSIVIPLTVIGAVGGLVGGLVVGAATDEMYIEVKKHWQKSRSRSMPESPSA